MRILKLICLVAALAFAGAALGCGGSGDKEASSGKDSGDAGVVAQDPGLEASPWHARLAEAGFKTIQYKRFPAQVAGKRARVLTYRSGNGKSGGVIYLASYPGKDEQVVWHWFFEDSPPDSIRAVELNDDGLWDVSIYLQDGATREYVQGEDFTFLGGGRDDCIAMNGGTVGEGWWQCFDGTPSTAFKSDDMKVEMLTPLGLVDGILTIQLASENQPSKCDVKVDGKKVLGVDLNETTEAQLVKLEGVDNKTHSVSLVFSDVRGGGEAEVSEVGVR